MTASRPRSDDAVHFGHEKHLPSDQIAAEMDAIAGPTGARMDKHIDKLALWWYK